MTSRVLILDFGSQYTQLIARRIREQKVYCEIQPCNWPIAKIREFAPQGVVLSGGPASVYEKEAPAADLAIVDLQVPILGICYGMQWLAHELKGTVEPGNVREYGPAKVRIVKKYGIFEGFIEDETSAWMSHGDHVSVLPAGFESYAQSANGLQAAIGDPKRKIYGLQFHTEVVHTIKGKELLHNFLFKVCDLKPDWSMESFIDQKTREIRETVGADHVLCAVSGGVDSSVMAALVHKAVGGQLDAVFIDNGLLPKDE